MKTKWTLAASAAAIALASGFAMAQQTTGSIRGVVTDQAGAPLSGAEVTVTNKSSGSKRSIITDSRGRFQASGLNVSGDYSVSVVEDGYIGKTINGLRVSLGDVTKLSFALEGGIADEIVVTATGTDFVSVATGPSATFTAADLEELPSTSRDIKDVIQLDPRVYIDETNNDGIFCVGSSNRANSLTIDGYSVNDVFGLNGNGYPTQRLPYPYDITQQIAVEIAPFDVEYGGFTGCNVNVVTRSGGNEFKGRLSFDYLNQDLTGDSLEGDDIPLEVAELKSYGGYVSGPIVKDRLFFTFGYEKTEDGDNNGSLDLDTAGFVNGTPITEIEQIQAAAQNVYNFDAGDYTSAFPVTDERYFLKLDGNINDNHRFEVSYQNTEGYNVVPQNTFGTRLGLSSNYYRRGELLDAYAGRLFSNWTDAFSTELRVSYQERETIQAPIGDPDVAQVQIDTSGGEVRIGPDQFRHANSLKQDVFNVKLKGDYVWGDHLFTAGYEYDTIDVFNLFVFASQGVASYDSITDFENQNPSSIFYRNAPSNDANDAAASFSVATHTLYAQDTWDVNAEWTIKAGLRYDLYSTDDSPKYNPTFQQRYGIRNDDNLEGKSLLQPRIAFEYRPASDLTFTGGIGTFSGGNPFVWVSNSYSNSGNLIGDTFETDPAIIGGFDLRNIPAAMQAAVGASADTGQAFVDATDPNFQIPSVTRVSLGVKYDNADLSPVHLGEGWNLGADILWGVTHDPVNWQAINLARVGVAPDGRPLYQAVDKLDPDCPGASATPDASLADGSCTARSNGSGGDFLLTNSDEEPEQLVLSAYIDNDWQIGNNDIGMTLGYAYTSSEDVNPGTSSRAISNFENFSTSDYNNAASATSNYEIANRFTARFDFRHEWKEGWATKATLFGQLNDGQVYSYTFDNGGSRSFDGVPYTSQNPFGDTDGSEDRDLLYVINGYNDPLVNYTLSDPTAIDDFVAFVNGNDELADYRGEIAPRNKFKSDWWGQVDLRLQQEVPLPKTLGDDRLRFVVDIDNFTNLLNDEWGVRRSVPFEFNQPVVRASIDQATGQYVIESFRGDRGQRRQINQSLWEARIGLRYDF